MTNLAYPVLYGVWFYGKGWLRDSGEQVIAFTDIKIARDTARRMGGETRYIDQSLQSIEKGIAARERRTVRYRIWHIWTNFFGRNTTHPTTS